MAIKQKHQIGCKCCGDTGCPFCLDLSPDHTTVQFSLVISGMTSPTAPLCCDVFNGTFAMTYFSTQNFGGCLVRHNYRHVVSKLCDGVSTSFTFLLSVSKAGFGPGGDSFITYLILESVSAGDTITINGLTYIAHATTTTVSSRQFSVSGTNNADATELLACLNDATFGVPGVTKGQANNVLSLTPNPTGVVAVSSNTARLLVVSPYDPPEWENIQSCSMTATNGTSTVVITLVKNLAGTWKQDAFLQTCGKTINNRTASFSVTRTA